MVKRRNIDKDLEIEILIFYKTNSTAVTCQEFNITPDRLFKILQANDVERHDAKTNRELTNLKKFGVTNPGMLDSSHLKAKQTTLERYGLETFRNVEKANATRIRNSGSLEESYKNGVLKMQKTNMQRYGVKNYVEAPKFQERRGYINTTRPRSSCYQTASQSVNINMDNCKQDCNFDTLSHFHWCVEYIFQQFRSVEFPYPRIANPESSYQSLCKADCDKFTVNSRIGLRVVDAYHTSIWFSNRKGFPSPYEAWCDNNLLKKCIENRLTYIGSNLDPSKVLYGFSAAKIAPKVSVFNPYLAKYLINKYLNEFETIFDPSSGYSGRMLGCCSLGKRYIGQDISPLVVDESCNIINDFQLDATVSCMDSLDTTECEYDCLFTCTPYGDKELWQINKYNLSCDNWIECLVSRYSCKKYLFVVDETIRYSDYIVETITNKSHLNTNVEYVILIDKTNS